MSQRMTAAEVVAELREKAGYSHAAADFASGLLTSRTHAARSSAMTEAADLVEQHLTPQVLDEPDGPGDYHVEGVTAVCRVGRSSHTSQWMYYDGFGWEPLAGRRVAKVPPGPFSKETLE